LGEGGRLLLRGRGEMGSRGRWADTRQKSRRTGRRTRWRRKKTKRGSRDRHVHDRYLGTWTRRRGERKLKLTTWNRSEGGRRGEGRHKLESIPIVIALPQRREGLGSGILGIGELVARRKGSKGTRHLNV
jgi:hypothetical protein